MVTKKDFLAVYDYGMGGLWMIISARSAQEISHKYPMLIPMELRPGWMTEEQYNQISKKRKYDIDESSTDLLLRIVQEDGNP